MSLDARRAFGRWFFIAAFCTLALYLNGVSYMLTESEGDALMALEFGMSMGFAAPVLPMLAALAHATSFCQEYSSGFCPEVVHRSGIGRYVRSKALFSALAGGLSICLGLLVFIVILNLKFPPWAMSADSILAAQGGPGEQMLGAGVSEYLLHYGGVLLRQFFESAFWALCALCFSAFYPNLPLTLCAPLVLHRLFSELASMPQIMVIVNPIAQRAAGAVGDAPFVALWYALVGVLVALLFCWRAGRRLRYA